MISLKKYVAGHFVRNDENIIIENELEKHFYNEFALSESLKYSCFTILEKYGTYVDQKELIIELAKSIYDIVRNKEPEDTIELDKNDVEGFSNIFFNKLVVKLTKNTGYLANKSKYSEKDKLFDQVVIDIDTNEYKTYDGIVKCLMHEMLHAYNEYNSYLKNSPNKLKDLTNIKSSYSKTIDIEDELSIANICKRILNNIRKWEQNAYISELGVELENNGFDLSKYHTTNDAYKAAYDIFINSDTFRQYSSLWSYLLKLKSYGKEDDKNKFADTYNSINNTNLTFNKIFKKLDSQFDKIMLKIESKIPKLFYDYYEEHLKQTNEAIISGRQSRTMIDFIQYILEYDSKSSVKADNGEDWIVYVDGKVDDTFTEAAKNWKKMPKVGKGWYAGGTVFKIVRIEDNKVYTESDC